MVRLLGLPRGVFSGAVPSVPVVPIVDIGTSRGHSAARSPRAAPQCLTRCLEFMEMSDADVGFTLLSAYQFSNATDLPFCLQTLRSLRVTAVLSALEAVCAGSRESQMAAARSSHRSRTGGRRLKQTG